MSKKVLITGASGLIGSQLTELLSKNHSIVHLGRKKNVGRIPSFVWDLKKKQIDAAALEGVDTMVHLAGANISDNRWTASWKKEILDSRIQSTALLFDALKRNPNAIKTFVSASAIGYYGFEGDAVFTEQNLSGKDFLAQVTKQWEEEVDKIKSLGIRVVKIRIGIVLTKKNGALGKMVLPVTYNLGSPLGSGNQFISWIHIYDLCRIFIEAIDNDKMNGTYNAVAGWATNTEMTKAIAQTLKRLLWLPNIPSFVLRVVLGEMAEIVLNGSRVTSEKIIGSGFRFKFSRLDEALNDLLKK